MPDGPSKPVGAAESGSYCVLACSPRQDGNSDTAAQLFTEGFAAAAGPLSPIRVVYLREHRVLPCVDCDACGRLARAMAEREGTLDPDRLALGERSVPPFGCPLTVKDNSARVLDALLYAQGICLVSPVYFYHLPAAFKALVDRTQPFWRLAEAGVDVFAGRKARRCGVVLLGARPRGEQLFTGSLLTLKYTLMNIHAVLAEPLLLHGLDRMSDLKKADAEKAREHIYRYGTLAAEAICRDSAGEESGDDP